MLFMPNKWINDVRIFGFRFVKVFFINRDETGNSIKN